MANFINRCLKMYGQRRWTVPALPSIKSASMKVCKIVTEMCVVLSPRSYAVRSPPRVRVQGTVKSKLLLFPLVLITLYVKIRQNTVLVSLNRTWIDAKCMTQEINLSSHIQMLNNMECGENQWLSDDNLASHIKTQIYSSRILLIKPKPTISHKLQIHTKIVITL